MAETVKKTHYSKYKDRLQEYYKKKVQCECGSIVSQASMYQHKRNNKHILKMLAMNKSNIDINLTDYKLCDCGILYCINSKCQHEKSKKHLGWLEEYGWDHYYKKNNFLM